MNNIFTEVHKMASDKVLKLTSMNFEHEVGKSELPVLVDFWAGWCGPCMAVAPIIEELAAHYDGKLKVGKVNVDEEPSLAAKYRIISIPTIMIFKNGEIAEKIRGMNSKAVFSEWIEKSINQ